MRLARLIPLAAALLAASGHPGDARAADDAAPPPPPATPGTAPDDVAVPEPGAQEFGEEIVVTATRDARPRRDVAAATTVVPRAQLERSPASTVDALLRSVPAFALLRQSSSLVADPSATGANLRGIGPSGISRSLVLVDGIPLNDPFGGSVYWRAIPWLDIERVEIVPGGGSALYGNYALGGVTQIFTRPATPAALDAAADYGSFGTYHLGLRASDRLGPVGAVVAGDLQQATGGYPVVAEPGRGLVDGNAVSWSGTIVGRAEAALAPDVTVNARASLFYEDENGGTRYTTAAVRRGEYGGTLRWTPSSAGTLELSLVGHATDFRQLRTRITTQPRATEALAEAQDVPAHDFGGSLLWTRQPAALAANHTLSVGLDARRTTGALGDDLLTGNVARRDASGMQLAYGGFVQDVVDLSREVSLQLALRYDGWENRDGLRVERSPDGAVTTTAFPTRSANQLSPKVALRVRPIDALTLRAAAYRSFRAPTLSELYRPFQVGLIVTDSNPDLGPEKLWGAEAGFELATPFAVTTRVTGFWNVLQDPISNVTLGTNRRQRQNLGEARIRGVEVDAEWRLARTLTAAAAYTFADAIVTSAPSQEQLVGKQFPLDPRHRATANLAWDDLRHLGATVQVRYVGPQFEDDNNTSRMGEFALIDVSAHYRLTRNLDFRFSVENLFDKQYLVGRAGVDTIGQPRFIHAGVVLRSGT